MRRWLAVAALGAAFLALPAWGQRRGGASGGFAGHTGFGSRAPMSGGHAPMTVNHPPHFAGFSGVGFHFGAGFNHPISSPFFFHHRHRFFRLWPYAAYYGYPYYSYPSDYAENSYSADSYQNDAAANYSNDYRDQQAQINRLENEVDRLREEHDASQSRTHDGERTRSKAESLPTQLVFRNKRTEEVENYAIVGQTFWVLNAQRSRKIPLAELDLPATKKANDDRGVGFELPAE